MPAFLVPVDPNQCLIPLEKAIVFIGRQADCDISLTHSRKISRRHCCIAQVNHKFIVRDLGSTNGVFLNGNRIQKEATITLGDDLIIGDIHFKMQNEAPVEARSRLNKSGIPAPQSAPSPAGAPPVPPPIPAARRSPAFPPIPNHSDEEFQLADDEDDDSTRAPNTLDGIRRHRAKR